MGSTSSPFASMTTYRFWASCVSISTTRISSSSTSQVFLPVSSLFSILSLPNQIYQDNASLKNRKKQQGILYLLCCLYSKGIEISTRTTALQIHTRQWVGTYAGKGNGDYRGELASALRAITAYLKHFAFPPEMALVRLDGAYGDATVVAQLLLAGMAFVTRWRGYQLLERPQIRLVLAHPPTASVTRMNSGEIVDLFDGGWLEPCRDLPPVRVMVVRHAAPPPGKDIAVGKRVGEWVYELFITTLDADGFLVEDVLDLYHGRGAFEVVLADEDVEEGPDRWCSYTECGQELWQIACQWVWNLRLTLGKMMQGGELREMQWAPPTETAPLFFAWQDPLEEYGPWQCAGESGRAAGRFTADAFTLQEDGKLRCPAGASLWLSEVRQENAFTQRAVYLAYQTDCQRCALREQCLASGAKGERARRGSRVRRLLPSPAEISRKPILLGSMRWVDVAGRALRRTWIAHWHRQYVEVLPLAQAQQEAKPPPRPPRAVRSHQSFRWQDRLARNAWWGPPQLRVNVAGVPDFLAMNAPSEELASTEAVSMQYSIPSSVDQEGEASLSASSNLPLFPEAFWRCGSRSTSCRSHECNKERSGATSVECAARCASRGLLPTLGA